MLIVKSVGIVQFWRCTCISKRSMVFGIQVLAVQYALCKAKHTPGMYSPGIHVHFGIVFHGCVAPGRAIRAAQSHAQVRNVQPWNSMPFGIVIPGCAILAVFSWLRFPRLCIPWLWINRTQIIQTKIKIKIKITKHLTWQWHSCFTKQTSWQKKQLF